MLVLSRRIGESIVVDDQIEVRVLDVQGGRVRLGFNAPAEVVIRRMQASCQPEGTPATTLESEAPVARAS